MSGPSATPEAPTDAQRREHLTSIALLAAWLVTGYLLLTAR